MSSSDAITRRRFLHVVTAASAGACFGCANPGSVDVLTEDFTVKISEVPELQEIGKTALVDAGTLRPIAITHIAEGDFIVTGTECNHQHCGVTRSGDGWRCPCHGSTFTLEGDLLGGPATAGLTVYDWTLDGDLLTILAP